MPESTDPPPLRPELLALPGYDPVEPLEALARRAGIEPGEALKLDANENPFGTPAAVREAVARLPGYHVYPDPLQRDLRAAIAEYSGASMEQVVAGAGSDELIELVVRALVGPGQRILVCPPTFGMYRFIADVHGVPVDAVERDADFGIDVAGVQAQAGATTALVILASPNNPTGNALDEAELQALLATGVTVVVDEAYAEYAGTSVLSWMASHPRLIVLRTFSKWAGLAGLRIGYGVFPRPVAEVLLRIKQPYNVNRAAEVAALAALEHRAELLEQAAAIVEAREVLFAELERLPWLRPYPSRASFLLCRLCGDAPERGVDGGALRDALAERGVFVRHFATDRLRDCVRISVPRPDQMALLLERLREAGAALGLR